VWWNRLMTDADDIRLALGDLVLAANQLEYEIARVACGRGGDPVVWACIESALLHPGNARKDCRRRITTAPADLKARKYNGTAAGASPLTSQLSVVSRMSRISSSLCLA
jgi:hypothetical protein